MLTSALLSALVLISSAVRADDDVALGQVLYERCQSCHGPDGGGSATKQAPSIAGQRADYLVRQLTAQREGARAGDTMHDMAATLEGPTEIEQVVAYLDTLDPKPPPTSITGDLTAGAEFWALCTHCHGQSGEGLAEYGTPKLTGQWDWYLAARLAAFVEGSRGAEATDAYGAEMERIAKLLDGEEDIHAVVAWINGLPAAP